MARSASASEMRAPVAHNTRSSNRSRSQVAASEQIEGKWPAHYLTLLAFPSLEQAKQWYASADYGVIRSVRWANA